MNSKWAHLCLVRFPNPHRSNKWVEEHAFSVLGDGQILLCWFLSPFKDFCWEKKHLWELPLICSAKKSSFCKSIIRQTGSMLKRLLIYLPTATSFGGNYCWYFVGGFQSWWGPPEPKVQLKSLLMSSLCYKRPLQNSNNYFEHGLDPPFWIL